MLRFLQRTLELGDKEKKPFFLAFFLSVCFGFSANNLFASSRALFMAEFEAGSLAYVYIGAAMAVLLAGWVFHLFEKRMDFKSLFMATILLLALFPLIPLVFYSVGYKAWTSYIFAVWYHVFSFLFSLTLWGLCGRIFHVRQAKRLYGPIGAGEFTASIVNGMLMPYTARLIGAHNLVILGCIGMGAALVLTHALARFAEKENRTAGQKCPGSLGREKKTSFGESLKDKYALLLIVLWALGVFAFYLIDTAFHNQARLNFHTSDTLAGFYGAFYAVGSGAVLLLRSLASGRMMNGLGVVGSLLILPLSLLPASLVLNMSAFMHSPAGKIVFITAVFWKFCDFVFRYCSYRPAFMVLYQPLPTSKRTALQNMVESLAEPAASLAAGGIILLTGLFSVVSAGNVSLIMTVAIVAWLVSLSSLRREYSAVLMESLTRRGSSEDDFVFRDRENVRILAKRLEGENADEVIFCLELLERSSPRVLAEHIGTVLCHPSPSVRQNALKRVERLGIVEARPFLKEILQRNDPPEVPAALKALAAIDEEAACDIVPEYLAKPEREIYTAAVYALLKYGCIEGIILAGDKLMQVINSPIDEDREAAARIIGETGLRGMHRLLARLLQDKSFKVRTQALASAEKMKDVKLAPHLLEILRTSGQRQALRAVAAIGDDATPFMEKAFVDPLSSRRYRQNIIRAAGEVRGVKCDAFLKENIFYPDITIRSQILENLRKRHFKPDQEEIELILGYVKKECSLAFALLTLRCELKKTQAPEWFTVSAGEELERTIGRILVCFSLVFSLSNMDMKLKTSGSAQAEGKARMTELLDEALPADLKKMFIPFLDSDSDEQTLKNLRPCFPNGHADTSALLLDVLELKRLLVSPFFQAACVYALKDVVPEERRTDFAEVVPDMAESEESIVRETAEWYMSQARA